ncbi:MAG: hypothetical protein ABW202_18670 [Duganella sp.]
MRLLIVMLAACLLSACTAFPLQSSTPYWDNHFGANARLVLAQQVIDPAAGRNTDAVAGIDGAAARAGYERYQKSFSGPPVPPVFVLGDSGK